ncbi:MAG TPA: DUF3168 domain-containing protein [Noviherbaspirillum sp.]|nr:DUF3168 domain-containing protein [Noviherbaspirillum sp.]
MTVEASIFDLLKGLVSTRVYPDVAPANVAKPYIVYQQVGGDVVTFVDNMVPSKQNGRFQFSTWAATRAAAATLALQVENSLTTAVAFQARPLGAPTARYEPDGPVYGAQQDFSIWSDR